MPSALLYFYALSLLFRNARHFVCVMNGLIEFVFVKTKHVKGFKIPVLLKLLNFGEVLYSQIWKSQI